MKKILKVILSLLLTVVLLLVTVFVIPVKVNTKYDDLLFEKEYLRYYVYNDTEYKYISDRNIFVSFSEAGIENDTASSSKKSDFPNNEDSYDLEYIYDGNVKRVFVRKYSRIIDFISPQEYLLVGNYYLVFIDKDWVTLSGQRLFSNSTIKMPSLKSENIEKAVRYIGVPDYSFYGETAESFIKRLEADKDLYPVIEPEEIKDEAFIDDLTRELNENGNINQIVDKETKKYDSRIQEMQKKIDAEEENENTKIGKVRVYYKIYFKDQDFPFRLILY